MESPNNDISPGDTLKLTLLIVVILPLTLFFNNCSGSGGGSSASGGGSIVQVSIKISSGGLTVGSNQFLFQQNAQAASHATLPSLLGRILLPSAFAVANYRVSPDKVKLHLTHFSFQPEESGVDTTTESAFNNSQSCEIDYDQSNPNQTFNCTVELQSGLHYKTIDFNVAPSVEVYINDTTNNIYTTTSGLTSSNPGAGLDYYTVSFNNNNTNFHAEFPFQIDTSQLSTTLSKITTHDACSNTIETKLVLSDGSVLSDVVPSPLPACGTSGSSSSTINLGTQNLNVAVDMIHGFQVDVSGGLSINTSVPLWTIVGTIGSGVSIKHYASVASGLTAATYSFPPGVQGINELKIAFSNGVAVALQMVPNGYSASFCHDDYDTPNNSPQNGYVGSDSNGVAWAVGPWASGSFTSYTSQYFLNTTSLVFSCKAISSDPDPSPGQTLNTFSSNMPDPTGWTYTQNMTRID
ncbi:MAG: hypothetical protein ACXWQQ_02775 [Pseudobdellovibrio sp.]